MKAQRYHSLVLSVVLSSALVLLLSGSNVVALSSSSAPASGCTDAYLSDGDCDLDNNTEECGYDGGDCCDCTCISTAEYICGTRTGFSCLDPSASCFVNDGNDDDTTTTTPTTAPPTAEPTTTTPTAPPTADPTATAPTAPPTAEPTATTPTAPPTADPTTAATSTSTSTEDNYVEAGTKTTVSASANAYDVRPGAASGNNGCQVDGCGPELTRDGVIAASAESRWSCAAKIVPGVLQCAIDFVFEDPQDIMDVEVAFYKGDERTRTVEVSINDEVVGEFDSYPGSTFNALGIQGAGVETLTLKSVGLAESSWISLSEVRFLVEP